MRTAQHKWTQATGWKQTKGENPVTNPQLIFAFGRRDLVSDPEQYQSVRSLYPTGELICGSTSGTIGGTQVTDDTIIVTALAFDKTTIKTAKTTITTASESEQAGQKLGSSIPQENLVHVLVFSDGLKVNGTALVKGLASHLPANVTITGGLVGDQANFKETVVGLNELPISGQIVIVGLYGSNLKVGFGSVGGWDPFGPNRTITKSQDNVLFELDGRPALSLYKEYLGEKAKELPGSGLLFPLSLTVNTTNGPVELVRTLLAVDEAAQSMTFAGDMPQGVTAKFMKANFERLIDGAAQAASHSIEKIGDNKVEFALLISCVGRKLVLKERTEEEVEAVQEKIDGDATIAGFYSYGEICPTAATNNQCQLHNQTMTITTLREE
jgi:hypothetical protein